ncbi:hypothetical protein [Botrimarina mediterranea]|uniref:hypothetical protein n=1 Tax=Botrimarina mediterranea TaxID=2528022 RepID=UPI001189EEAB|nr:hypothetical protein K2D_16990 [Planctomycetes bacterium K2D]
MADLSITPASVAIAGGFGVTKTEIAQAEETITQGDVVVQLSGETTWRLADANAASNGIEYAGSNRIGYAITPAAADGYFVVATEGPVIAGATLTVGTFYIVSTTPGGLAPISDFSGYTDSYCTAIGQATSTTVLDLIAGAYTGANNIS